MSQRRRRLPKPSRILAALAALFLTAAVASLLALPDRTVGDPATIEATLSPTTTTTVPPTTPGSPETLPPAVEQSNTIEPNSLTRLEDLAPATGPIPVRLSISAIGIDAPITESGVDSRSGQMEVPRNVQDVAWYRHGPSPGEPGSAVLAAHVDLASQGRGVFFNLRTLQPGDVISVGYDDGSTAWFQVSARTIYDKAQLPLDVIFSRTGAPVLTLVTCGGGFNSTAQSYDSNVVVYATPLAPPDEVGERS